MMLSPKEQIHENVKKSQNILICIPKDPTTDAVAAGLALFSVLEKMDKKSKVVCSEFTLPPHNQFLPKSKEIVSDLTSLRKFIISLDVSRTKVEELSYDIKNDQLDIYITPKDGTFREKDVSLSSSDFEYDLIFVLDAPDLEMLGKLYENNMEFFYHTPIINIDHNPANDNYGQINLVDLTATSTSEIIFELVKHWKEDILDEYNATSLLAGIISKTKSFQTSSVTPRSLAIASHLISSGARREEIIRHLYQTKTVETLKLWGRALARLKQDKEKKIVWSVLKAEDFIKSGSTSEEDVLSVIDELIIDAPEAETVIILFEPTEGDYRAIVSTPSTIDALSVFREYHPEGTKDFTRISIQAQNLDEAEQRVLSTIQSVITSK